MHAGWLFTVNYFVLLEARLNFACLRSTLLEFPSRFYCPPRTNQWMLLILSFVLAPLTRNDKYTLHKHSLYFSEHTYAVVIYSYVKKAPRSARQGFIIKTHFYCAIVKVVSWQEPIRISLSLNHSTHLKTIEVPPFYISGCVQQFQVGLEVPCQKDAPWWTLVAG